MKLKKIPFIIYQSVLFIILFGELACKAREVHPSTRKLPIDSLAAIIDVTPQAFIVKNPRTSSHPITQLHSMQFLVNHHWLKVARIDQKDQATFLVTLSNNKQFTVLLEQLNPSTVYLRGIDLNKISITKIKGAIRLHSSEEIYGFGETWNNHFRQRGQKITIWDQGGTPDECAYFPYFVSTNNYAFYIRYGGLITFDVGRELADEIQFEIDAPVFDMCFITGDHIADVVQKFAVVNGLSPAPPRWAYKPWFWLMGPEDDPVGHISQLKAKHVIRMAEKLKARNIPIGVTWFEPPWQNARTSFIPDTSFSKDLAHDISLLEKMGIKSLAWTVPYTTDKASNWLEATQQGYLVRKPDAATQQEEGVRISASGELAGTYYNAIDFYNPEAYSWWQSSIQKALQLGFKGFKLDAGQDVPPDALLHGGLKGKDVHNAYATPYNKVFAETLHKKYGSDYLLVGRAAWLGSAPYNGFKWPGDLSADFGNNGLPSSVYSTLSLSMSGQAFVSTDIGGFENRKPDWRVWIRWAQFGSMLPGMQTLNMPWWFDQDDEDHFRYLAWLHTDLTPFWASLAKEASTNGTPICRPLVWDYQQDKNSWYVEDQYTIGNQLLVAPIINGDYGRQVYLPAGLWYDFWDPSESHQGPLQVKWHKGWEKKEAYHQFPLYVKEGAIIPMQISNNVTGFGWTMDQPYQSIAIWPKVSGSSSFTIEDSIQTKVDIQSMQQAIAIHVQTPPPISILRIQLDPARIPKQVKFDEKHLKKIQSFSDFKSTQTDSWMFQQEEHLLWIRLQKCQPQVNRTLHIQL